jgi:hypothetical protein
MPPDRPYIMRPAMNAPGSDLHHASSHECPHVEKSLGSFSLRLLCMGNFAYAMGNFAYAMGNFAYAMGNFAYAMGNFAYAMGKLCP